MDEAQRDTLLQELLDNPGARVQLLRVAHLDPEERNGIDGLLEVADAVWIAAQAPPALAEDPVAAMLGLVPDPECQLSSAALTRARKTARLQVGQVATRLNERGWQYGPKDVFRWENRTAVDVPPAVVQALADIVNAAVNSLIVDSPASGVPESVAAIRANPRFADLINRWATAMRVSTAVATAALESRTIATVHRGDHPDSDQLLATLDALVASVEHSDSEPRHEP